MTSTLHRGCATPLHKELPDPAGQLSIDSRSLLVISTQKEAAKASSSLPVAASNISHDHKGIISGLDLDHHICNYAVIERNNSVQKFICQASGRTKRNIPPVQVDKLRWNISCQQFPALQPMMLILFLS